MVVSKLTEQHPEEIVRASYLAPQVTVLGVLASYLNKVFFEKAPLVNGYKKAKGPIRPQMCTLVPMRTKVPVWAQIGRKINAETHT